MPRRKSTKRKGGAKTKAKNGQGERKDEDLPPVSVASEEDTEMNNDVETGKVVEEDNFMLDDVIEAVRKYKEKVKPVLEEFEKIEKEALEHVPIYSFPTDGELDDDEDVVIIDEDDQTDEERAFLNMVKAKFCGSAAK